MRNSKYDIGFFLSDPAFIDWVKNPSEAKGHCWIQWLERHPDARENLNTARAIVLGIDYKSARKAGERKEEILRNILDGAPAEKGEKTGRDPRTFRLFPLVFRATAAVLLFFLVATFFYRDGLFPGAKEPSEETALITKCNPRGQKMSFYLPDNTRVVLNAGSTLSYPAEFGPSAREVKLDGEAYFNVQHDSIKQFIVRSGDIHTRVHGTAFNVKAYKSEAISVALERGSVSVGAESYQNTSFPLFPGEKLTVNDEFERSERSLFDYEEEFGWKEGVLVFRDAGIDEFTSRIERWYDVNIVLKGLESRSWKVTGSFKHQSLETVLESLEFTSGVSYDIREGEVTIYAEKTKTEL